MRIGVSLSSTHQVEDHRDGARSMIERASVAYEAGLDHLGIGDHHSSRVPYYQNVPMLGRLLAEWRERPAGARFLLPLWSPVLLAEQIGTLASMHDGTFVVQTGLGGRPAEFAAMGRDIRRRVGDFEETVRVVQGLLAGETVSSERFGIVDAAIAPRPMGRVEWWMGSGVDAGLARAARLGDAWYASPSLTFDVGREMAARFREHWDQNARAKPAGAAAQSGAAGVAYRAADGEGDGPKLVLRQDGVIADTAEEAWALAQPILERGYRGMTAEHLAIGSVSDVAARFERWAAAGFTDISMRQMSIDQSAAVHSLGLLGEVRAQVS